MSAFAGFPEGRTRYTPIPDLFFSELLPAIDNPAELKLTLFMFWSLHRQQGYPRYLTLHELEGEGVLLSGLSPEGEQTPIDVLHAATAQAVARGTLLQITVSNAGAEETYLFLNSPQGRQAVQQVKNGELELEVTGVVREPHIERERRPIFELYEQNIGLLQPLLAEELAEADATYPREWIEEAFKIAVEQNARKWSYIAAILDRWARDGKDAGLKIAPDASRRGRRRS